jgi:hypothetical protein
MVSELKKADAFLRIGVVDESGNKIFYYGGDQAWFKTNVGRYSGCGAVAAANIFAYLSLQNPKLAALFPYSSSELTADVFLEHMYAVIKHVHPRKLPFVDMPYSGLVSLPRFARYCEAYAASRRVGLKGQYYTNKKLNAEEAIGMIAEQLTNDNPIALLIMQNRMLKSVKHTDALGKPVVSDLRFHWVVITSLNQRADAAVITVSSEGSKVSIDFNDVWNGDNKSLFGWRGIAFFLPQC